MKRIPVVFLSLLLLLALLTGCSASQPATKDSDEDIDLSGGTPSAYDEMQNESSKKPTKGSRFNIRFTYRNDFYGYDLEANWADVFIKKEDTNTATQFIGLENLLDGSLVLFEELDADNSGTLNKSEWAGIEGDFPFKDRVLNDKGEMEYEGFRIFGLELGGLDLGPTGFTITQPTLEGYALELNNENAPVSIKIMRASTAGFSGAFGKYFQPDTVFIELASDFEIFHKYMPDMTVTSAFDYPLLDMYVDDTDEVKNSYSHGSQGFSSIVDTEKFNGIFDGNPFYLHYAAYYEGKVVGTYDLTITPRH